MRKNLLSVFILISLMLCGCAVQSEYSRPQSIQSEIDEEKMSDVGEADKKAGNGESEKTQTEGMGTEDAELLNVNVGNDGHTVSGMSAPTKEEVLAMRVQVLEGMSGEEAARLTENIKVANLTLESAYLYDAIFEELKDSESLYWNYFDNKGDIQIGWTYDGSRQDMKTIMKKENLSQREFYAMYGTPVMTYNRFHAENFINLLEEMKEIVQNERLQEDLQQMIDATSLAAETHDVEYVRNIYHLLHDMDYYLLRYGPEDVGIYVADMSTISKYYGVLGVYGE